MPYRVVSAIRGGGNEYFDLFATADTPGEALEAAKRVARELRQSGLRSSPRVSVVVEVRLDDGPALHAIALNGKAVKPRPDPVVRSVDLDRLRAHATAPLGQGERGKDEEAIEENEGDET